jgi:hypothetical protein
MFDPFVVCCVGSGVCDELITRTEESYRVRVCVCLIVCDIETPITRRPRPELGCRTTGKENVIRRVYMAVCTLKRSFYEYVMTALTVHLEFRYEVHLCEVLLTLRPLTCFKRGHMV